MAAATMVISGADSDGGRGNENEAGMMMWNVMGHHHVLVMFEVRANDRIYGD